MEVVVFLTVPLFVCGSSISWAPLQLSARPPEVPLLSARSRRITNGSSLLRAQLPPSDLRPCCQCLPCSKGFLLGVRRASPVPMQPFLACHRHYPAGIDGGHQPDFRHRCCLHPNPRDSASGLTPHEDCAAFDTCGPQDRSPVRDWVCQETSHPAFALSTPPQLHGSGFCHVGTHSHWVTSASLVIPGQGEDLP